jgi:hypothetical protein
MSFSLPKHPLPAIIRCLLMMVSGFFFTLSASAQIYKWTDAQGKVHYSDKKIADTAQAQDINLGTMPAAKAVTALPAKHYDNPRPSLYVLRSELSINHLNTLRNPANFAYFYFGGDCVSPTAVSYQEYFERYKNTLPRFGETGQIEEFLLNQYRIRNQSVPYARYNPRHVIDAEGNPPLKLKVDIVDIRINVCLKHLQKAALGGYRSKINSYGFDKVNIWLQLQISLSNSNDQVLFNTITEGSADESIDYQGSVSRHFRIAYEQAITNLIANPQFIAAVTPKSKIQVINIPDNKTTTSEENGGLLDNIVNKLQSFSTTKAKLAKVITSVSPVRVSILHYYVENGKWPDSFLDIDLSSSDFAQKDLVESAELRLGGVLHLRLARSTFGENEVLQLIPKTAMNGQSVEWECRTSLDKSLWVGDCQGL